MIPIIISTMITLSIFVLTSYKLGKLQEKNGEIDIFPVVVYLLINCITYGLSIIIIWENIGRNIFYGN